MNTQEAGHIWADLLSAEPVEPDPSVMAEVEVWAQEENRALARANGMSEAEIETTYPRR